MYAGDRSAQHQPVDVVRAFVRVYGLQVHEMSDHVVLVGNAVPAQRVPGRPGDFQRLPRGVPLYQRYHFRRVQAQFLQPAHVQAREQSDGYLRDHVRVLRLDQLRAGQRFAELFAVQTVRPGHGQTGFGRSERAPRDPVTGVVQTAERPLNEHNDTVD